MKIDVERIEQLVGCGLMTDGAHHKQWYLEQIAKEMGIDLGWYEGQYEKGIAP